jgi:hypothetical protein
VEVRFILSVFSAFLPGLRLFPLLESFSPIMPLPAEDQGLTSCQLRQNVHVCVQSRGDSVIHIDSSPDSDYS